MTGQTKVLWKATVINAYKEQNKTHDLLSNENRQTKSSLGENSLFEAQQYYN